MEEGIKSVVRGVYKSWTIWFNSIMGTLVIALPYLQTEMPQLETYLPPDAYKTGMGILVAVNIMLRFKTNSALGDKK